MSARKLIAIMYTKDINKHILDEFLVSFSCYSMRRHPARTGSPLGCDMAP